MKIYKKTILIVLLIVPLLVFAKRRPTDYYEIAKKYQEKNAIYLKKYRYVTLSQKGDKINIQVKNHIEKLILNDDAQNYSTISLSYSSFRKIDNIKATLYDPVGKRYKKIDIGEDAIKIKTGYNQSTFYSDSKSKVITFPTVKKYSLIVLDYTEELLNPHFLGSFVFQRYIPAVDEKFILTFPNSIDIKYFIANNDSGKVHFSQKTSSDSQKLFFSATNMEDFSIEDNALDLSYYVPHVLTYIASYKNTNGEKINMLSNVKGLYSWYYSMVKDIGKNPSEEIKTITDSLLAGTKDTITQVKNIFHWAQDNLKYVAFESGMGGYIPRSANLVCKRRYGDCKDMSALMYTMMNYAGIKAHLTWIGTRKISYNYEQVSAPYVDNHMIVSVSIQGKTYFLDATDKYVPFGMPSEGIQGKQALVGIDQDHYKLVEVPIIEAKKNYTIDSTYLALQNDTLTGSGEVTYGGSKKVDVAYQLAYSNEKQYDIVKQLIKRGSDKFKLIKYKLSDIENKNAPIKIKYKFQIPDYVSKIDDKIYINLNLNKPFPNKIIDIKSRKYAYEYPYKNRIANNIYFRIPKNYDVGDLPTTQYININPNYTFKIQYSVKNDMITVQKEVITNTLVLKKDHFKDANKFIQDLNHAYHQTIVLKPNDEKVVQTKKAPILKVE